MTVSSSRIPRHTLDSAPEVTRPVLEALAQRSPTPGKPINLHAQMAHSPAVLFAYMAMRKALEEHGTLDRKTRSAMLLATAADDGCAYATALNQLIASQTGWSEDELRVIRHGHLDDPRLDALLRLTSEIAKNRGRVDESTWQAARAAGWSDAQLLEAFGTVGLTQFVDAFANFAQTELEPALADAAHLDTHPADETMRLTHLLIVDDQDRTRAFYEHVLGAKVIRERDPVILQFHNSWIIANVGGLPTDDKPDVTLAPPLQPNVASYALNVRVADAHAVYEQWRSRGGHFLTPPIQRDGEIRCYLRDPDGHLIEVGQLTGH